MPVNITIVDEDGSRVSIEVSSRDTDVYVRSVGVRLVVGYGPGRLSIRIGAPRREDRKAKRRPLGLPGEGGVSPQMEAAAVRAFLGAADATRLGRSLSEVYRAMDAVRRGQDASDDDADGS